MTALLTPEVAAAAAETALAFIPTGEPLTVAIPTPDYDAGYFNGTVVRAKFTGAKGGDVLIAVEQTVADALANSPLGQLELTAALNPALEAVVSGFGNVRLSPAEQIDVVSAFTELLAKQDAFIIPLEFEGVHRAMVGLAVTQDQPEEEPAGPATPNYPTRDEMVSQQAADEAAAARAAQMQAFQAPPVQIVRNGLELLRDVAMEVTAQIGSTRMTVSELLSLTDGAVIELDRNAGAPADLLVNGHLIARGEVVVIDENFGLRITEIVTGDDSENSNVAELAAHR